MADIIIDKMFHLAVFSWGTFVFKDGNESRKTFLNALKRADKGDYALLILFSRS